MKIVVVSGALRPHGNTEEMIKHFMAACREEGAEITEYRVADKNIRLCTGCSSCQETEVLPGCVFDKDDDMFSIAEAMIDADIIVFASPIYSWYCTAELKIAMDRMYGLCKPGERRRVSALAKKWSAVITSCVEPVGKASKAFETSIKDLSDFFKMDYLGMWVEQDKQGIEGFKDNESIKNAKRFARRLIQ
jgi:multimeric flavodoxin WrbA